MDDRDSLAPKLIRLFWMQCTSVHLRLVADL